MNEFPGAGQQPAGNPRGWSSREQRTYSIRKAQAEAEARARRQEVSADGPVRVRLVWDAGIPSPVTKGLGQAEQDLFRAIVNPDPGARQVPDVQDADFTVCAGDGFVVDSPGLPHIAVGKTADVINVLLVPARLHPFPPVKTFRPFDEPGPGSPFRKPGSGFSPTG